MPEEFSRTTARKKIVLPGGDTIYVPVITKISFIDPFHQYQEYQYQIDNTDEVDRTVHVDLVSPVSVDEDGVPTEDNPTAEDASDPLYVERIDTWNAIDPFNQHQESRMTLDNVTGNDQLPPHFSNHTRTHIYRYHKDPQNPDDDGVWIDSELIDEFAVIDPFQQYQEHRFTLVNPTNAEFRDGDLSGQASDDDPDLTIGDGEGTEAIPVRLDPFQNIVNFSSGYLLSVTFSWSDEVIGHNLRDFVHAFFTVTSVNVSVTAVNPSLDKLYEHQVTNPFDTAGGAANTYSKTFVFDVASMPSRTNINTAPDNPLQVTFQLTSQEDYNGFLFFTYPIDSSAAGITEITDGIQSGGPWPTVGITLYSKAFYHFDETDPLIPIKLNNPTADLPPDDRFSTSLAQIARQTTFPSTDNFYYPVPFGTGPPALVTGGTYSTTGLLKNGSLVLNLERIPISVAEDAERKPAVWPSTPAIRTVDYVPGDPNSTTVVIGGFNYKIPNPPQTYNFGIYSASAFNHETTDGHINLYKFGGPPIPSNEYTGTYPHFT